VAFLALTAIVGGTIFGPLPSLALQNFQTNTKAEIVAPQTTIQTAIPKDRPRATSVEYSVVSGETLSNVASKYNISVDTIKWANGLTSDQINPGQKLVVPPVSGVVHTVGKSETLQSIAKSHGVSVQAIVDFPFNDIAQDNQLSQGQILVVPGGKPVEVINPPVKSSPVYFAPRITYFATAGNSYPFGQCTYYVANRRGIPWTDNAGGWYRDAIASGFRVGSRPAPGAIMVSYEGSAYGHVSYVEAVNPDGSWVVSEMNYYGVPGGGWGRVDHRTIRPGTVFVVGFIY